jgi:hypothetical protein
VFKVEEAREANAAEQKYEEYGLGEWETASNQVVLF